MKIRPITLICEQIKLSTQKGVGLIEVLVALVILSVGLLGIASLYVTALQAKTTSLSRMKAAYLAQDMADRMRANPTAVTTATDSYTLALDDSPVVATCQNTSICTPTEMAIKDKYEWTQMIKDASNGTGLPGTVKSSITITNATTTTPAKATIYLKWSEPSGGELDYTLLVQI